MSEDEVALARVTLKFWLEKKETVKGIPAVLRRRRLDGLAL